DDPLGPDASQAGGARAGADGEQRPAVDRIAEHEPERDDAGDEDVDGEWDADPQDGQAALREAQDAQSAEVLDPDRLTVPEDLRQTTEDRQGAERGDQRVDPHDRHEEAVD